ncbi:unnamed protein product, partial [Mesorhabditis belari]|uniref:Sodium/nucleoside cotransporter n=1 Tax=Mesorhabditis belari TaxID=2138241 RepID=A0AAF3F501_9BILA
MSGGHWDAEEPVQSKSNGHTYDLPEGGDESSKQKQNGDFTEPEYLDEEVTGAMAGLERVQHSIGALITKHKTPLTYLLVLALVGAYHGWLIAATVHDSKKVEPMWIISGILWALFLYYQVVKRFFGKAIYNGFMKPMIKTFNGLWKYTIVQILFYLIIIGVILGFLVWDTWDDHKRLTGLGGMGCFVLLMFCLSNNRTKIKWRPVIWGFFLQFCLGLLVLRWDWGSKTFEKISNNIVRFLDYTNNGTNFVFGFLATPPNICDPISGAPLSGAFAFTSLQVVIYFGSIVALLYYYGVIQFILKIMAWFMTITLGTTATESLNACACVFLGQSEAPLLIKPYLEKMTASEIHAVMTSGFSCIAGSLFAAYIAFGACPVYLLSATVMSACGSLACSKILFPETEESKLKEVAELELPKGEESNPLECISNGAVAAVELVLAIVANLIVFLALLAFIDNIFRYAGELIGHEGWSFQKTLGYIFYPLAYVMGVTDNTDETLKVAQLMGTKTALNEFIAYQNLGTMVANGELSPRAAMIATYALCGFSNFSSIGIQLGVLGGMCPSRKQVFARVVLRALLAGCISCFFTACVAGVLVETPAHCTRLGLGAVCFDPNKYLDSTDLPTTTVVPANIFDGHNEL